MRWKHVNRYVFIKKPLYNLAFLLLIVIVIQCSLVTHKAYATDIPTFAKDSWESGQSDTDLQYIASHYDVLIADGYSYYNSKVSYLHQQNPNLIVLAYRNGTAVTKGGEDYSNVEKNHPEWFLKDSSGNRVFEASYPDNFVLDPGNPEWRKYRAAQAQDYINVYGYDGVYFDMMSSYIWVGSGGDSSLPINPKTGKLYTDSEWKEDIKQYLAFIKQTVGTSKLAVFNGPGTGTGATYYQYGTSTLVNEVDGMMVEGFTRWSGTPAESFRSEADWKKDVDQLVELSQKGKTTFVWTSVTGISPSAEQEKRLHLYSVASFLLAKWNKSYYTFWRPTTEHYKPYDSLWSTKIGSPVGAYYKKDNVYQRDFTTGKVLVNPSDINTYIVSLGKTYQTLDGEVISQATLAPDTGLILLSYNSSSSGGSLGDGDGSTGDGAKITASITLDGGKTFTNKKTIDVTCTTNIAPLAVSFSNDGSTWSTPQLFISVIPWTLSAGDGKKTVYAKFQTAPENWGDPVSANITLDTTPPKLSISDSPLSSAAQSSEPSGFGYKNIIVQATDESGIDKVEFYLNDKLMVTDTEAPYAYRCSYALHSMTDNALKAIAYDEAGNTNYAIKYLSSAQASFKDVESNYWAKPFIDELSKRNIISGFADGQFRPGENVTRAEFAKIICLAMGWELVASTQQSFSDVPAKHWACSYVETAKVHGAIDGYKDGTFRPSKNITRAEISKIIAITKGLSSQSSNDFTDVSNCWAKDFILSCAKQNVISGYPDRAFKPQKKATRAEAAKILAAIIN